MQNNKNTQTINSDNSSSNTLATVHRQNLLLNLTLDIVNLKNMLATNYTLQTRLQGIGLSNAIEFLKRRTLQN